MFVNEQDLYKSGFFCTQTQGQTCTHRALCCLKNLTMHCWTGSTLMWITVSTKRLKWKTYSRVIDSLTRWQLTGNLISSLSLRFDMFLIVSLDLACIVAMIYESWVRQMQCFVAWGKWNHATDSAEILFLKSHSDLITQASISRCNQDQL